MLDLPIGQRQIVEIARLLARDARVLILDEPTATLSDVEIERLMGILKGLKAQGHAIIYISHRLGEVFDICDSVTVLRNGAHISTGPAAGQTRESLIEDMLGRAFGDMYPPHGDPGVQAGGVTIEGLTIPGQVHGLSLFAPKGRITAIAGQIGSGAGLVNRALAGLEPAARGAVLVDGKALTLGSAPASAADNLLFVSDDRAVEGLFPDLSSLENFLAADLCAHVVAGVLSWRRARALGVEIARKVGLNEARLPSRAGFGPRHPGRAADERTDARRRCGRPRRHLPADARFVRAGLDADHDHIRVGGGRGHGRSCLHIVPGPDGGAARGGADRPDLHSG